MMAASGLAAINFLREASRHFGIHAPAVSRAAANAGRPGLPYARAARRLPACNAGRPGLPYIYSLPLSLLSLSLSLSLSSLSLLNSTSRT